MPKVTQTCPKCGKEIQRHPSQTMYRQCGNCIVHKQAGKATQEAIFSFIIQYKRNHDGTAPTLRERRDEVGLASTSPVYYHLERLEEQGRIVLEPGRPRGIKVPGGSWEYTPLR